MAEFKAGTSDVHDVQVLCCVCSSALGQRSASWCDLVWPIQIAMVPGAKQFGI